MSLEHAKRIDGFTDDPDLEWLAAAAAGRELVVEFGAWAGRSTVALATAGQVIAVDTWAGSREHADDIASGRDLFSEWCRNTSRYRNVSPRKCNLHDKADRQRLIVALAWRADMVFIDAAHDYESVRQDIETARAILRPGGLLCGHDYQPAWPGVMQAVDELVPGRKTTGVIWYEP